MNKMETINNYLEENNSVIVPVAILDELEQMAGVRVMLEIDNSKDADSNIETWVFEEIEPESIITEDTLTLN